MDTAQERAAAEETRKRERERETREEEETEDDLEEEIVPMDVEEDIDEGELSAAQLAKEEERRRIALLNAK